MAPGSGRVHKALALAPVTVRKANCKTQNTGLGLAAAVALRTFRFLSFIVVYMGPPFSSPIPGRPSVGG